MLPTIDVDDIQSALSDELAVSSKVAVFTVAFVEREGDAWKIQVRGDDAHHRTPLDESLEGQTAWWPGPPRGAADVLSVVPEELQINLRFATTPPPPTGDTVFVYPPRYLEAVKAAWSDLRWVATCERWVAQAIARDHFDNAAALTGRDSPLPLRAAQRAAMRLPGWSCSFLWGPAGTGKTYTLGALLSLYLQSFPTARVLLLSTTNAAVDLALVSVDTALDACGGEGRALRGACQRLGAHFIGAHYVDREHLLPISNRDLVRALAELEAKRPDPARVAEFAAWKRAVEETRGRLRSRTRDVLEGARLSAATTTAAAFLLPTLRELPPYDLVVFDEASQVGLAHALSLAPLGRRALFAGDPRQLAPIAQAAGDCCARWLEQSPFCAMQPEHQATCFLNEQSRMAEPICALVSGVFYDRKLVVAADAHTTPGWRERREQGGGADWSPPHLWLEQDLPEGTWSKVYGGPIRHASSEWIVQHIDTLLDDLDEQDVLILTPFRAQRALVRSRLRGLARSRVRVSTVHRAQGSEQHTVVFDPVDGASPFFARLGDRLVNVALSRAQARLVLLFSPRDLQNCTLRQVAELVRLRARTGGVPDASAPSIGRWLSRSTCPAALVGRLVRWAGVVGEVQAADDEHIEIRDASTGALRRFKTAFVKQRCAAESTADDVGPDGYPAPVAPSRGAEIVRQSSNGLRLVKPLPGQRPQRLRSRGRGDVWSVTGHR
jgi:DNA replication ATP-dependent helicase Dna2